MYSRVWLKSIERPRKMSNCRWVQDPMHLDHYISSKTEKSSLKSQENSATKIIILIRRASSETDHKLEMKWVLWLIMLPLCFLKEVVRHSLWEVDSCLISVVLPHPNLVSARDHSKLRIKLTCFQNINLELNKLEWLTIYLHLKLPFLRKWTIVDWQMNFLQIWIQIKKQEKAMHMQQLMKTQQGLQIKILT